MEDWYPKDMNLTDKWIWSKILTMQLCGILIRFTINLDFKIFLSYIKGIGNTDK